MLSNNILLTAACIPGILLRRKDPFVLVFLLVLEQHICLRGCA